MSYNSNSGGNFPNYGALGGYSSSPSTMSGLAFYNQLCDAISSNIFAVNNNATAIDRALKQLGTANDTNALRDKIQQTIHNTNMTLGNTNKCIKDLALLAQQGDKQQRLQLERLKNEFQETLQRYSTLQKQIATKMKYTMPIKPPQKSAASHAWGEYEDDDPQEKQSLIDDERRMQKQKQLESELELEQAMLLEREQRISEIESDMIDVNQIMTDLANLVHQQADTIYTIEANVERAAGNVDDGRDQLSKASNYQKKYRQKLCCLIVILVLVAAVLGIIIYFSIPKN